MPSTAIVLKITRLPHSVNLPFLTSVSSLRSLLVFVLVSDSFVFCEKKKLIAAVDDFDSDEFSRALGEFNSISPMDNWKVDRLVKVKRDLDESKVEESLGDDAHELL